ncbi:MAG TPA: hypothetical protein VL200_03870 [Lacunisphaera sp.]|jgi:hypothetical protein|nr:hypothetical protein [Lacunisphaera sp.]
MSRHVYWLSAALLLGLVLAKFDPVTGFTSLIRFGDTWQNKRLPVLQRLPIASAKGSNGYDGQFYATVALDPLLRDDELNEVLDAPAYRARRILLPIGAHLAGFGRPWWVLQAFALLNVACWFVFGWLLRRVIAEAGWRGFARWFACMFGMGVLESVRQSLVDLPSLLLLALAIEAHQRRRSGREAAWFGLAALAKETSLLGTIAVQARNPPTGSWRRAFAVLFSAALPLALWSIYVDRRFPAESASGLGNLSWPFVGLLTQLRYSLRELSFGNLDGRYSFGLLAMVGLGTQAVVLWRHTDRDSPWWRVGAAYSILLVFLSYWVWSGYWAVCRAVMPMTVAFNLLLSDRKFWRIWLLGNLTLLHAIWRFL